MSEVTLWDHQKRAIRLALENGDHYGLFFEAGTGKTAAMIHIMRALFNANKRVMRTLILAPTVVCHNWVDEFALHSQIPRNQIRVMLKSGSDRVKRVGGSSPILITNYESLQMKALQAALAAWPLELLVCDESHKLKNPTGVRAKAAMQLARIATHRYILSGSPVLNSPMDLFSQFCVLDRGQTFGGNFFAFRARYFYDANAAMPKHIHFPNWKPRPGAEAELSSAVARKTFHIKKSECLDLPPLVKKIVKVPMSPPQASLYEEMKKHFLTYVGSRACVTNIALTKVLRMQQILSGHLPLDDGTMHRITDNPRAKALEELLETYAETSKVIVWAVWKEDYKVIRAALANLGLKHVELTGETKPDDRRDNIKVFNEDPDTRVLLGNPGAGGIGINLTAASVAIFYSRTFSLESEIQAEARNYRGGSEIHSSILRIDLVSPGTIDEIIQQALANKQDMGERLISDITKKLAEPPAPEHESPS